MSFQDYSQTPAANTALGDGTYIGPNMLRNKVRPALQQLAADGREMYDEVIARGTGGALPAFIQAGTGAVERTVQARLRDVVSVLDFIPAALHGSIKARTCAVDLTPYMSAAIAYVDYLSNVSFGGGATLYFPSGDYLGELDASNADPNRFFSTVRFLGDGHHASRITPPRTGAILLNCVGRNQLTVENMGFWSAAYVSQVGIYLSRSTASTNCNGNRFIGVRVAGNFGASSVVSIGAESSRWSRCLIENTSTAAAHRLFFTGNDPAKISVTLPVGTTLATGPNTDNYMSGCIFYAPYNDARPVTFSGQGGWTLTGCSIIAGERDGVHLVTYQDTIDGYFSGPVSWVGCHFEVFGESNAIHWIEAPASPSYWYGISVYGGNAVISPGLPMLDYDRAAGTKQPILQSCTWTSPIVPVGVSNNPIYAYAIQSSSIHYRPSPTSGLVVAFGFVENSAIDAGELRTTNLADTTEHRIPAPIVANVVVSPVAGTYGRGTTAFNPRPAVGSPLGWACTAGGTLGTLGAVTATTTNGSNAITVAGADVANLYVGAKVTIATATNGPFIVQAMSGATVYLDRPVTNSVSAQAVSFSAATFSALANL